MKELAQNIIRNWKKLRSKCEYYNPQLYPGYPHLTTDSIIKYRWCNHRNNKGYISGHCSMSRCPIIRELM